MSIDLVVAVPTLRFVGQTVFNAVCTWVWLSVASEELRKSAEGHLRDELIDIANAIRGSLYFVRSRSFKLPCWIGIRREPGRSCTICSRKWEGEGRKERSRKGKGGSRTQLKDPG